MLIKAVARWCLSVGWVMLVLGCNVATKPIYPELIGTCLQTEADSFLYESACTAATGKYLIATRAEPGRGRCTTTPPILFLEAGSQLKITNVFNQGRGTTGNCLRVTVQIVSEAHQGEVADLPVCWGMHPYPQWILSSGIYDASGVQFHEDFISTAQCNFEEDRTRE
ncbi:MAG: hypothetical protein JJU10_08230 [Idiomarina sp.]|nr:hypothetical protein [Idiomarina sp.]